MLREQRVRVEIVVLIGILLMAGTGAGAAMAMDMERLGEAALHARGPGERATAQQRTAAETLAAETRTALTRFKDFKQAVAEGYLEATTPGVDPRSFGPAHYRNARYVRDGKLLDPEHPEGLVYWKRPDDTLLLLGAYFIAPIGQGPEVGGPLTRWHNHVGHCPPGPRGEALARMSPPRCGPDAVPGPRTPEMLHVWLFDHPAGVFADHLGPDGMRVLRATYGSELVPFEFQDALQGRPRELRRILHAHPQEMGTN